MAATAVVTATAVAAALGSGWIRSHTNDQVTGRYILATVDGAELPVRIYDQGEVTQDVLSGVLSFTDAGVVQFVTVHQNTLGEITAPQVDTVVGSYVEAAAYVSVNLPRGESVVLARSDVGLTVEIAHLTFEYRLEP